MVSFDATEKRIYELMQPYRGRSWKTLKIAPLDNHASLNQSEGMNMDPLDAEDLLTNIFTEFCLNPAELNFSIYYPENRKDEKPLTINMLIESAKAGRRWISRFCVNRSKNS